MSDLWVLVQRCLTLAVDLAESVEQLNANLVTNKPAIAELGHAAPDLWDALRRHAQAKRIALAGTVDGCAAR